MHSFNLQVANQLSQNPQGRVLKYNNIIDLFWIHYPQKGAIKEEETKKKA